MSQIRQIGDFEIVRELGRGGMGVVYEAMQLSLRRKVALKVIHGLAEHDVVSIERFRREASSAAKLTHPNITQVFSFGEADGHHFIAMEFVEGRSLDRELAAGGPPVPPPSDATERLDRGGALVREAADAQTHVAAALGTRLLRTTEVLTRTQVDRFVRIIIDAATAVHAAHEAGVLHRDIKPANILLGPNDTVKLADFGLARNEGAGDTLTSTGQVMGTLAYMAPEQLGAKRLPLSRRTDIYALGVTLYETLTRRRPFDAPSAHQLIQQIQQEEPVPPTKIIPSLSCDLSVICLKAMEKDPERRYATASEFADDLRRYLNNEPILARPAGTATKLWRLFQRRRASIGIAAILIVSATVTACIWWKSRDEDLAYRHSRAQTALDTSLMRALNGSSEELLKTIDDGLKLDPTLADLYLQRGFVNFNADRPALALKDFDAGLKLRPADPAFQFAKGTVLKFVGRTAEATPLLAGLNIEAIDDPLRLTAIGFFLVMNGRANDAVAALQLAKEKAPGWPQSRFGLALAYFTEYQDDRAEDALKSFIDLVPKHHLARVMLAVIEARHARVAVGEVRAAHIRDARQWLESARRIAPNDALVATTDPLVLLLEETGDHRAKFLELAGKFDAIMAARSKDALNVSDSKVYEIMALVAVDYDMARAKLYAQKSLDVRHGAELARLILASERESTGDVVGALADYRSIHRDFPQGPLPMVSILRVRLRQPELVPDAEALDLAGQINGIRPEDPDMLVVGARVFAGLGNRTQQARQLFAAAITIWAKAGNIAAEKTCRDEAAKLEE